MASAMIEPISGKTTLTFICLRVDAIINTISKIYTSSPSIFNLFDPLNMLAKNHLFKLAALPCTVAANKIVGKIL